MCTLNVHCAGVLKAVHNVNDIIAPALVGKPLDITKQSEIDHLMLQLDGTDNKGELCDPRCYHL